MELGAKAPNHLKLLGMVKLLLALLTLTLLSGSTPLKVSVTPTNQFAPGSIRLTIRIEPDIRNRYLCWGYQGGDEFLPFHRSCMDIDGDKAPKLYQPLPYTHIPDGDYSGFAELFRIQPNEAILKEQPFHVVGDER